MQVFVFPGQGSQKRGMGAGLFDEVAEFRGMEREVDALLGYSLRTLCLEDTAHLINKTEFTQPALFVVNALHYYKRRASGQLPDCVAGHSLGEYNALLASGAFDFLTGIRIVKKRGELMAEAKAGAMAAVTGLAPHRIGEALAQNGLLGLDVANYNSSSQTVISGPFEEIKRAAAIFAQAPARVFVLPVSAAFHSRYMAGAGDELGRYLESFRFGKLRIPVISTVTGKLYPEDASGAAIRSLLVRQMSHPVQWLASIQHLLGLGAACFEEIGPGSVLTKLIQQIRQESHLPLVAQ